MGNRVVHAIAVAALTLAVAACNTSSSAGRVFFVSPKNGDTIKTLHKFVFSNERLTISPVPPGNLTPEQVRAGMTHYHLGVDTDCLPAGTAIPKADPWIHFGQGNSEIEMQLKPGQHKLVLQSGDDLHRTLPGLCETINVTVVE